MKVINLKNENLIIDKAQKEPIIIINDLKKDEKTNLRITIKKGVHISIIELFLNGISNKKYSFNREIITKKNAKLTYLKYQDASNLSSLDIKYLYDLNENSIIQQTNLELGEINSTNNYISILNNKNASLEIAGLVKLNTKVSSTSNFNITHIAKSCTSNIKYKHSLDNWSKATFQAKSIVENSANFSKVFQNTNTILLSDDATIFAQPHLEINIDELEASHGATAGSLDEEQLLYLQSRGIEKELASQILLKAFENEIYDNIIDKNIKNFITEFKRSDYV